MPVHRPFDEIEAIRAKVETMTVDDFKRLGDAKESARKTSGGTPDERIAFAESVHEAWFDASMKALDEMSLISRWREWRDRKANRNFSIASAKTGLLASERSGFEYAEPDAEGERAVLGVEVVRETIQAVELRPYLDPVVFARMVGPWEAVTGVALRR